VIKYKKGEDLKCPRCGGEFVRLTTKEYVCRQKCFPQIKGSKTERVKWHDIAYRQGILLTPWEPGSKYL